MQNALVVATGSLSSLPDQHAGSQNVYQILTNLPVGYNNAFYMDRVDLDGKPITIPLANRPEGTPDNPEDINVNDPILFDVMDGLFHKCVIWKERRIRQRGSSFDWLRDDHGKIG